ncbi:hypothetical protein BsWGS_28954 [Bradybaena similaris]
MADNRWDELLTIAADLCTCRLCDGGARHPIILACYHMFCSDCLLQYFSLQTSQNGQRTFPCPVCSLPVSCPEDSSKSQLVDGGQPDTFTARMSEVLEAFRDEKKCDICLGRDDQTSASEWCMDCYEALCEKCTKVHLCGKMTRDHLLVAMPEFRKMSLQTVMRRSSSPSCRDHPEEVVKLYCLDCGLPVCVQCLTLAHKQCQRCVPLPEARQLVQGDLAETQARLARMTADSSVSSGGSLTGRRTFTDSVQQTEAEIRSLAEELRSRISQLETALLEKLRTIDSQFHDKIEDVHESLDDDVKILTSAQKRMAALLKYGSDLEVLDIYHSVKDTMSRLYGRNSKSPSDVPARLKVRFDIDDKVKSFRRDLEKLGDIRVEDSTLDEGFSAWGVTVTPRDEIIVADCRSKRVQKFISTGLLIDQILLTDEPRDLTSFGPNDVAITIRRRQILVVDITGNLELRRRVDTQKQYDGIAFASTFYMFLVSCLEDRCVDIITTTGEITKTCRVNTDTLEPIFGAPRYVAITKDGQCVCSDTVHNTVTCISQDGAMMFTYAPSDEAQALRKAQGVCCDKSGNIFVADYGNARIHLLTSDGNFQRFILGRDSELYRPVALAMTHTNKLVVVQSDGIVKIFSYEGNKAQDGGQDTDSGRPGRSRFYSSTSPNMSGEGRVGRRFSESSGTRPTLSSLSAHAFRSRHF